VNADGAWDDFDNLGRPELRWGAGFVIAAGLFALLIWLAVHWMPKAPLLPPPAPSAMMIELAPLPMAPAVPPSTPPEAVQKLPVAPPAPVPKIPVLVLPRPKPVKHRHIVTHNMLPKQAPSKAPPAQETAPALQTQSSAVATPNTQGSVTNANAIPNWQSLLMARLDAFKRYPLEAQEAGEQGVVYVHFAMDRNGKVLSANIAKSSGFDDLDDEVLDLIYKAAPLPPPPPEVRDDPVVLTVPVQFFLVR
jgi:protein TonB